MPDRISATGSVTVGSSATGEIETANGFAREKERAMQARRLSGVLGRPGVAPVKKGLTFPECGFHLESSSRAEPSRAEPSRAEPSRAEPSRAEPSRAEPSRAEPSRAEPSRAEPSRAEPSRAEPSRAEPSRAEPSRAEPSRAEPSRAEPSRAEPSRAEPSRAEPSRAEPSRAEAMTAPRPLVQHCPPSPPRWGGGSSPYICAVPAASRPADPPARSP